MVWKRELNSVPADELEDIEHELECVEIQIEAQRVVNAGKEEDFKNKQKSLDKRKKELSEILSKDSKPCTAWRTQKIEMI